MFLNAILFYHLKLFGNRFPFRNKYTQQNDKN